MKFDNLKNVDIDVYEAVQKEIGRQRDKIELIASENFVSEAVLEAVGSPLTNKYAEGYPGKRYYGGCEYVDIVETLAIERAKELFGASYVNVQPHSGAQANTAVYFAFIKPGDTILGMDLSHGGHLSHGMSRNISGILYNVVSYGVLPDTYEIDYDDLEAKALEHRPKMIVAGASAYSRVIDFKRFREVADKVGAYLFVDMAHIAGLVAAGIHPNPLPYADVVTTTTHKTLRGPRGGMILSAKEEYAKRINSSVFPGQQGGPLMHVIAGKAVALKEALSDEFKDYQHRVVANAKALAAALIERDFHVLTGGTDNHLLLIDLRNKGLTGQEVQDRLDDVNITCNKNTIPFDEDTSPFVTGGIRLGTPAVTTRGLETGDMETIAECIDMACRDDFDRNKDKIREVVAGIMDKHPLYL